MALEEYKRKRNFDRTPEPAPGPIGARKNYLSYLIQKHDATRLHYDFRLEWNGALLSWAVTKGPSLNPADKRLAVRTEDHPLSYGTFEGTIPKGQYGGGTVMLWDEGTWEPKGDPNAGLKKGHLSFTLHGERLKGDWDLIRMHGDGKKENWLLIKGKDAAARANGDDVDFLDDFAFSVKSGRSMEAIAGVEKSTRHHESRNAVGAKKPTASPELVFNGITITHPDRVISEIGHVTKGELADYHATVAPYMLPHLLRHPLSLLRCPSGTGKQCFYQRNPGRGLGADVKPFQFKHKGKSYEYLFIEDAKGLIEIIQMGAIEIHPWGASVDNIDYPDRMIFDLDPAPDVPFEAVKLAAQDLRQKLKAKSLESMLKCTGGKGLHVTVPLAEKDDWPTVKAFASSLAHEMVEAAPSAYVATMTKSKRNGKIFIDFFRNDYTATAIANFSVRARPGTPVALPISWRELGEVDSASQFTMKDVLARLKRKKPPEWPKPQRLPAL